MTFCLIRPSLAEQAEFEAASEAGFTCVTQRSALPQLYNAIVVARYAALPFYHELEIDIKLLGGRLINTISEHEWIANMEWAFEPEVGSLTFPTWTSLDRVPRGEAPFILKGRTNSKKQCWRTHMFAQTWDDALEVQHRLEEDGLIGDQAIVVRKYTPLVTYFEAIGGMPITKEFRAFVCDGQLLTVGYYWHSFVDDFPYHGCTPPELGADGRLFLERVIDRVGKSPRFYVADIAQDQKGNWWLVELNDGQQSGLSGNDARVLYRELFRVLSS